MSTLEKINAIGLRHGFDCCSICIMKSFTAGVLSWIAFSLVSLTSANAEVLRNCTSIPSAGGEIDGEHYKCNKCRANGFRPTGCVKCGTVTVVVPDGKNVVEVSRTVNDLRWAAWLDDIIIEGPFSFTVKTSLKNWEDSSGRQICLTVVTD